MAFADIPGFQPDEPRHGSGPNGQAGQALPCLTPAAWAVRQIPPADFLLGELFSTTSRSLLNADTGLGKTMFAMALAFAMRLGRDFLHWQGRRPARVLFIDGEMPRDLMQERIAMACSWFGVDPPTHGLFFLSREDVEDMPPLDTPDGQHWLDAFLEHLAAIDFIIFDNLMALCTGDLRDEEGWAALKPYVFGLTRRKIGQLWLHHVGHDKSRGYGTKSREWIMDAVLLGEKVEDDTGADVAFKLTFPKARRRKPSNRTDFAPVQVEMREGHWVGGETTVDARRKSTRLPPSAVIALEQLHRLIADAGELLPGGGQMPMNARGTTRPRWRARCYEAGISDGESVDARLKSFNRAVDRLNAEGLVGTWASWVWFA